MGIIILVLHCHLEVVPRCQLLLCFAFLLHLCFALENLFQFFFQVFPLFQFAPILDKFLHVIVEMLHHHGRGQRFRSKQGLSQLQHHGVEALDRDEAAAGALGDHLFNSVRHSIDSTQKAPIDATRHVFFEVVHQTVVSAAVTNYNRGIHGKQMLQFFLPPVGQL